MIQRLRKRFIRIAMLSVALVLLALTLIVNIANFVSTNRDINEMLDLIYEGPDRKSTRLNSSHPTTARMPSSA